MTARGPNLAGNEVRTVLVVDDEERVRRVLERMIAASGFGVVSASSGAEALETLRARPEAVACVVLDVNMPDMDGLAVLREIRKTGSRVPVILSTGEPLAREEGTYDEPTYFIKKPYMRNELIGLISKSLG